MNRVSFFSKMNWCFRASRLSEKQLLKVLIMRYKGAILGNSHFSEENYINSNSSLAENDSSARACRPTQRMLLWKKSIVAWLLWDHFQDCLSMKNLIPIWVLVYKSCTLLDRRSGFPSWSKVNTFASTVSKVKTRIRSCRRFCIRDWHDPRLDILFGQSIRDLNIQKNEVIISSSVTACLMWSSTSVFFWDSTGDVTCPENRECRIVRILPLSREMWCVSQAENQKQIFHQVCWKILHRHLPVFLDKMIFCLKPPSGRRSLTSLM